MPTSHPTLLASLIAVMTIVAHAQEDIRLLPPIDAAAPSAAPPAEEIVPTQSEPDAAFEIPGDQTEIIDADSLPWLERFRVFIGPAWSGNVEMGLNGSEGNSDALSFRVGSGLKRDTPSNTLELLINYGRNRQGDVETQNNGLLTGRWDWKLSNPDWIVFNRLQLEYDKFKAFDLRMTLASGLGYHLIKNDRTTLTPRLGTAVSHEFGGPDDSWIPEADVGLDFSRQISAKQSIKAIVDYFPSWGDLGDYRLVSQVNWEMLLDEATNLSLKLGAIDRYDSTPNGRRPNDIDYFLTLIWKL